MSDNYRYKESEILDVKGLFINADLIDIKQFNATLSTMIREILAVNYLYRINPPVIR